MLCLHLWIIDGCIHIPQMVLYFKDYLNQWHRSIEIVNYKLSIMISSCFALFRRASHASFRRYMCIYIYIYIYMYIYISVCVLCVSLSLSIHIDGFLPKGPYPPCLRMADRALLAGYPRYIFIKCPCVIYIPDAACPRLLPVILQIYQSHKWVSYGHIRNCLEDGTPIQATP